MTRWISKSPSSALALALASGSAWSVGGCGSGECGEDVSTFEWTPTGPGTAAVHVHGSTPERWAYVAANWYGHARNLGAEPCRLAVYEHAHAPEVTEIPILEQGVAAPETAGEGRLLFETLLPGAREGIVFVRELDGQSDQLGDGDPFGEYLEPDDDEDLNHIDLWLTVATCAAPDVKVEIEIRREVCPERGRGSVLADRWWPAPQDG